MIPVGYMAKRVCKKPDWLQAAGVADVFSVSSCVSNDFADYVGYWKHNGYWLFNSPEEIRSLAAANAIDLAGTSLFYYEAFELEFNGASWQAYEPDTFKTTVIVPSDKQLEGFDVVTFYSKNQPECSPLSCNYVAKELTTNSHCLFDSFEQAETNLKNGAFRSCEPGPYRIFSVYSVDWS